MYDSDVMTYGVVGLSLLVSAIQGFHWFINANPRAVAKFGRLAVACLFGLTPMLLLALALSGRSTLALMLGAFILPLVIWSFPRWRAVFGAATPHWNRDMNFRRWDQDFNVPVVSDHCADTRGIRSDLVQQSLAVLNEYLEHAARQGRSNALLAHVTHAPDVAHATNGSGNSGGLNRGRMSTEEALDILGLDSTASADEINDTYYRLYQKLEPELGETHYLISKIREAKTALLDE